MDHTFINVVVPFNAEHSQSVRAVIEGLTEATLGNRPTEKVSEALTSMGVIHFMSMTVIDPVCPSEPAREIGPAEKSHLLIEISSDWGAKETLSGLAIRLGPELRKTLAAAKIDLCNTALDKFLIKHNRVIGASWHSDAVGQVFSGTPGMTVRRILDEKQLAARIGSLIDYYRKPKSKKATESSFNWYGSSQRQRLDRIRDDLWKQNIFDSQHEFLGTKWAFVPVAAPCLAGDPANPWEKEISPLNQQFWKATKSVVSTLLGPLLLPFSIVVLSALMVTAWHTRPVSTSYPMVGGLAILVTIAATAMPRWIGVPAMWIALIMVVYTGLQSHAMSEGSWVSHVIFGMLIGGFILNEMVRGKSRWWLYLVLTITTLLVVAWLDEVTGIAVVLVGILLAFAVAFVLIASAAFLYLLHLEKVDRGEDLTPPSKQVKDLMEEENYDAQNHLASISRLKGGLLRRLVARLAFIIVGTGRFVCPPGFLGKNGVIHFARWMILPGTDQLLFWSNYDNTWQSYVGDFIADAPTGVTGIWSNCVGFPKTKNLILGGAMDRDRLTQWARRQQHATTLWYSAYPDLTAERIRINAAIRQGFASAESDADVRDWFALFGSKPTPPDTLQLPELPTLVFGGLSSMPYSRCYFLQIKDSKAAKEWLADAVRHVTYGEILPGQKSAIVIAFSSEGLRELGIPEDSLSTFPTAFQQGMDPDYRARMIGDIEENAPSKWEWGSIKTVHILLLLYGLEPQDLNDAESRSKILASSNGVEETVARLDLTPLPPKGSRNDGGLPEYQREPFGFVDGVSQPIIRGSRRSKGSVNANDLVAPGELVLGYEDNLGKIPPSPTINAGWDPNHLLPDAGPDLLRRRPEFSRYEGTGQRDLGANGTFLVVRQLAQDVSKFNNWLERAVVDIEREVIVAAEFDSQGNIGERMAIVWGTREQETDRLGPFARSSRDTLQNISWTDPEHRQRIENFIAAKLVGRWKDGTSLVRCPIMPGGADDPPTEPDNDFLFGKEDPAGFGCPFGAHIRRANPRETRFPGDKEEIATTNRHRILRVGRRYDNRKGKEPSQGLLFMCINADIERQFEFIQKTWLMNPNIHGLESEIDPIMGQGDRKMTIPTATGPIRLTIDEDFVRVKGGGYFFLPGRAVLRYLATASFDKPKL
jgi:deferrochelatase/peroxidase EfeB